MRRLDQSFDGVPEVGALEVAWKKIQVILNDSRPMDDKVLAITSH